MSIRRAALFDMDRTLIRVNSGNLFILWKYRRNELKLRDLLRYAGWIGQYSLGWLDHAQVTGRAIRDMEGIHEESFVAECREWYAAMVRAHISDKAREEVARKRDAGYSVAILSAATPYATRPLAEELGIDHVLCTQLEVSDGRFTGDCKRLCYGVGKVELAEEWASEHGIDLEQSAFYTDSASDLPMLEKVGEPRVINPDPRLRWVAYRRGWSVERW